MDSTVNDPGLRCCPHCGRPFQADAGGYDMEVLTGSPKMVGRVPSVPTSTLLGAADFAPPPPEPAAKPPAKKRLVWPWVLLLILAVSAAAFFLLTQVAV